MNGMEERKRAAPSEKEKLHFASKRCHRQLLASECHSDYAIENSDRKKQQLSQKTQKQLYSCHRIYRSSWRSVKDSYLIQFDSTPNHTHTHTTLPLSIKPIAGIVRWCKENILHCQRNKMSFLCHTHMPCITLHTHITLSR